MLYIFIDFLLLYIFIDFLLLYIFIDFLLLYISIAFFVVAEITEMLPGILNQLGSDSLAHLKRLATAVPGAGLDADDAADDDDEVPGAFHTN